MTTGEEFAGRLRYLRNAHGVSQRELANILYLKQQTVANYEGGRRVPNIEILIAIANHFDVTVDWLLGRKIKNQEEYKCQS